MSLFDILGTILIGPLKLLFEVIFSVAYKILQHPGLAVIVLSLVMNILVLPLYRRADAIQIEARDTENKLRDTVAHIKKTFSGDERMMILQTYYRQNNYNPLSVLSGSVSLLLEIPFFMAAYQFLSHVDIFQGVAFGPISDLSVPDGLLVIGGVTINLLPIIMTTVNVISCVLYLKGFPLKTKIQLYGMALFFLVFLYSSPAALVFYWTLNNLFSLVKTLFYRIKNARTVLNVLLAIAGAASLVIGIRMDGIWRSSLMIGLGIVTQLPWLIPCVKRLFPRLAVSRPAEKPNKKVFILGAIFLSVLVGLLIPSTYISASPQEFIDPNYYHNPVWYIVHTLCISVGTFLVWLGVFYWLAQDKLKVLFSRLVWIASIVMLVNYMFFGTKLGIVSADLVYTEGFGFSGKEQLINIAVILALAVVLFFVHKKFPKVTATVLLVGSIALGCMSALNVVTTLQSANQAKDQLNQPEALPSFNLSTEGNNVVVIMLDRAFGPFVPYMFEEKPELVEKFDGFTYYENTLAYGGFTNFGVPCLAGGYEYTPANMNLRSDESLVDKHDEALKVLPAMFAEKDYEVTVLDPSYAGYQWIPDLSVFDGMENVTAYIADGKFDETKDRSAIIGARTRNFFFFSVMKTLPVSVQSALYDQGQYRALPAGSKADSEESVDSGEFMSAYNTMRNMITMTEFTNDDSNNLMIMYSNLTHEPVVLQEPDYTLVSWADNSAFYSTDVGKPITAGDSSVLLHSHHAISHYHVNMLAMLQLGDWFDQLRAAGVYDNTRIILVSDHARYLNVFDIDPVMMHNIEFYQPLLMVKDFGATGFTTSDAFMTHADTPLLATEGLIENPVNPFTGNVLSDDTKNDPYQYVIASEIWDTELNNGNQFMPSEWAAVSGDVSNKENWQFYTEPDTLPEPLRSSDN